LRDSDNESFGGRKWITMTLRPYQEVVGTTWYIKETLKSERSHKNLVIQKIERRFDQMYVLKCGHKIGCQDRKPTKKNLLKCYDCGKQLMQEEKELENGSD
jgi:hypothetical protein